MNKYPKNLNLLITYLKKLPGVGGKTAERFAFQLLNWSEQELQCFGQNLITLKEQVQPCLICGCLMDEVTCSFCISKNRNSQVMCIISNPRDVYSIEETGNFQGVYHVINGLLSPIDGKTTDSLNIIHLQKRVQTLSTKELILAFDSTIEGDATALFIKELFPSLHISRLAFGMPIGSSLDFIDEGTLSQALVGRQKF